MYVYPIASGKGGVGKSVFSLNAAISIAEKGKRVIIVDLDLGGSNIHLMFSMKGSYKGIGFFLEDELTKIEDIVYDTPYKNLKFIPGDNEIPSLANLSMNQKKRLVDSLLKLSCDYLILDLGAGSSLNIIDFFLVSKTGIVVVTPSSTSIVNAYLFLKNVVYRIMQISCRNNPKAAEYVEKGRKSFSNLKASVKEISNIDKQIYENIQREITTLKPKIVFNMLMEPRDSGKIIHLKDAVFTYIGLHLTSLGIIYKDDNQNIASTMSTPITICKKDSLLSKAIHRITDKILSIEGDGEDNLSSKKLIEESFRSSSLEAETDFQDKLEYVQDLLNSNTISTGDLIEMVKNQQIEIEYLKKQNMMFKSKIVKASKEGFKI